MSSIMKVPLSKEKLSHKCIFILIIRTLAAFLLCTGIINAQTRVSGNITDRKGEAIIGANVFVVGSYDGGVTDINGDFDFECFEEGRVTLQFSYLGFQDDSVKADIKELQNVKIELRESIMTLDAVVISASTFKAGDNSKLAVLKPLDILTTAGSVGDVVAAMQTLPGTQANPEDGRLFIRGGEARETSIYIDGLKVFTPFMRTVGGSPTRGRYSPMLFKGVSFSTGGYSSAFGQALSGILDMNTIDEPKETETNIGVMTLGGMIGHVQKGKRQSISLNTSYINLTPYSWLAPSRIDWIKPFRNVSGEAVYRYTTEKGLFKSYISAEQSNLALTKTNLDFNAADSISIRNSNFYLNSNYKYFLTDNTSLYAGISVGLNQDLTQLNRSTEIEERLNGMHARLALKTVLKDRIVVNCGIDHMLQSNGSKINVQEESSSPNLDRTHTGLFQETDYFFSKRLAIKIGSRVEYNSLMDRVSLSPRITLAQQIGLNGQVSLAYGQFTQEVNPRYLYFQEDLAEERATHYLVNYNFKTDNQIFRLEGYYKDYNSLVRYNSNSTPFEYKDLSNDGEGYAYGIDVFWRANNWIENLDFWMSYSWIEHERSYRDFPVAATPSFSTKHNFSFVSKLWIPKLKSQLGLTHNVISGRPYENPNTDGFLNERAKVFNSVNLSWAYVMKPQQVLFLSVNNVTRFKNEFGYEYASLPNNQGVYNGRQIRPAEDQFLFIGFFLTMSKDKTKNQLDNL